MSSDLVLRFLLLLFVATLTWLCARVYRRVLVGTSGALLTPAEDAAWREDVRQSMLERYRDESRSIPSAMLAGETPADALRRASSRMS